MIKSDTKISILARAIQIYTAMIVWPVYLYAGFHVALLLLNIALEKLSFCAKIA